MTDGSRRDLESGSDNVIGSLSRVRETSQSHRRFHILILYGKLFNAGVDAGRDVLVQPGVALFMVDVPPTQTHASCGICDWTGGWRDFISAPPVVIPHDCRDTTTWPIHHQRSLGSGYFIRFIIPTYFPLKDFHPYLVCYNYFLFY